MACNDNKAALASVAPSSEPRCVLFIALLRGTSNVGCHARLSTLCSIHILSGSFDVYLHYTCQQPQLLEINVIHATVFVLHKFCVATCNTCRLKLSIGAVGVTSCNANCSNHKCNHIFQMGKSATLSVTLTACLCRCRRVDVCQGVLGRGIARVRRSHCTCGREACAFLYVYLSARPSVTRQCCVKTNERRIMSSPLAGSTYTCKVHQHIRKGSPIAMALNQKGMCPEGDFPPLRRRNSESCKSAKLTINH